MTTESIKKEGLDIRTKAELDEMLVSHSEKIPRVQKDLDDLLMWPDAKKKEIYESLLEGGEIAQLDSKAWDKIDAEYQHEVEYYQRKVGRLTEICTLIEAEKVNRGDILH